MFLKFNSEQPVPLCFITYVMFYSSNCNGLRYYYDVLTAALFGGKALAEKASARERCTQASYEFVCHENGQTRAIWQA